LTLTSV